MVASHSQMVKNLTFVTFVVPERRCYMEKLERVHNDPNEEVIYRPYIRIHGVTYYARNYGHKVFRIVVGK